MTSLKPGDVLASKYRLEEIIGRGGFATVYRAVDLTLDRQVAVKLLEYGGEHGAARFVREAKILGELQDGHTMRLFDFGRTDDGGLFMVCELLGGQDLSDLLEARGTLTAAEAEHIMRQVLSSLREAHAAGLLHRDVKPANIRVHPHNDDPLRATLMDFGVARQEIPGAAKLTATGARVGTAAYMAPEQAIGDGVGPGTDLFALALVTAQCIIGDLRAVRSAMMSDRPLDLRAREPLRRALNAMLELDISDRPRTADAVFAILDSPPQADPPPAQVRPPGPQTRQHQPSSGQHVARVEGPAPRNWLPIIGTLLSVIVIGGVFTWGLRERADPQPPVRVKPNELGGIVQTAQPEKPTPAGQPDMAPQAPSVNTPGCGEMPLHRDFRKQRTSAGLDTYEWYRYLPEGYDPTKKHPVLVAFHTDNGSPGRFTDQARLREIADAVGLVVIVMRGAKPIAWGSMYADGVESVLKDSAQEVCTDLERVVVLGYGSGGFPAEMLSCEPWVHATIFVSHRSVRGSLACPDTSKPILFFQPMKSKHFPIEGGKNCSGTRDHVSLAEQEEYLRERNNCPADAPRQEVSSYKGSTCFTWRCEIPLTVCHVDGGHQFPNSGTRKIDLLNCDGPDPDYPYTKRIVAFLESVL